MLILEAYRDIGDIRGTSPVCPGGIGGHTGHTPLGVSRVPSRVPVNGPIRNVPVKTRQGQKNGMLLLRKNFSARPTSSPGLSGLHIPTTSALEGKLFHGRVYGGGGGTREGTGQAGTARPAESKPTNTGKKRRACWPLSCVCRGKGKGQPGRGGGGLAAAQRHTVSGKASQAASDSILAV
jgi:hypothetical protein